MTVVIPDETPDEGDTSIVVAPTIVVDTPTDDDSGPVDDAPADAVEAVIVEEVIDVNERLARLEGLVAGLAIATPPAADPEPDIVIEESGDGDVIVTGDDSPVGVPWTHKRPSIFGGGN
jgi:hypothetical protein